MRDFTVNYVCCGEIHHGLPAFGYDMRIFSLTYQDTPAQRVQLNAYYCVIDEKLLFIKGILDITVHNQNAAFSLAF